MSLSNVAPHPTASVSVASAGGAPELDVVLADHRSADVMAGPAGSRVIDPELTALAYGDQVLTWVDAYSHGLQAEYAVLNPSGKVIEQASYGSGYTSAFEAVALPGGGFGLADAETDLFGLHGSLTFRTFGPGGASAGPLTTVATDSSASGGLVYADLEGFHTQAGTELSWTEAGVAHSALIESNGTVLDLAETRALAVSYMHALNAGSGPVSLAPESFGLPGPSHDAGWFA